jgi:hypothetical protein|uniref:Uncharacterized protein n=1 Tax=viral metagenome TaxID=1070528 RepID=A0A6C0JFV5_9ZZZZ
MTGALFHVDTSESNVNVNVTGNLNVTSDTRITGLTNITGETDVADDLNVGGNIYGKGIVINTTQYIDTTDRSTTSGSEQNGFTTGWTSMKAKSKVNLDVHIPYRNDGNGWGGSYHTIYMMVNKQVGTVPANHWVTLSTSGYHMVYHHEILSYTNNIFIPLVVNEDFQIRFKHMYRVYNNGTLHINYAHHLHFKNDSDNAQFGIPHPHAGYVKFIVQEIGG